MVPVGHVVAKPVSYLAAGAGESAASDDQGALVRSTVKHGIIRCDAHHMPIEVVGIVVGHAVLMDDIREDSLVGETPFVGIPVGAVCSTVMDRILRIEQVAAWEANLVTFLGVAALELEKVVVGDIAADDGTRARRQITLLQRLVTSAILW
jgi:hypothetical protein